MPEAWAAPVPPRPELLRLLRARLEGASPGLRFAAEGLLGAERPIDWLAVEPGGRAVLLLVGTGGNDLELVALGLAHAAWVEARLGDWRQLAPQLELRPGVAPRVVLLCPEFQAETLAAARALGDRGPELIRYVCLRLGTGTEVLVEPVQVAPSCVGAPASETPPFRSGLSEAELSLSPEERAEFAGDGP